RPEVVLRPGQAARRSRCGVVLSGPPGDGTLEVPPGTLALDELVQPAHFALHGLHPVALELECVVVEALSGPRQGGAHLLQALLQPTAAALEHAHAHVAGRLAEEGEARGEGLVLVRVGPRLGEELFEVLLPLRRQPVDDLGATARERSGEGVLGGVPRFLDQPAVRDQRLEAGVERSVTERPEHTQQRIESFAQLIAVHRRFAEQTEDSELEDPATPAHRRLLPLPGRAVPRRRPYAELMDRLDTSRR